LPDRPLLRSLSIIAAGTVIEPFGIMFNFNRTLRNFGFGRRPQTHYARNGSGIALPVIAALAYRYREPIMRFVREKMGQMKARGQQRGYTNPGETIA
jgi:hypothetical protein